MFHEIPWIQIFSYRPKIYGDELMIKAMIATSTWWKIYKRGLSMMLNGLIAGLLLIASIPLLHVHASKQKMNKLLYLAWPLGILAGIIVTAAVIVGYVGWTAMAAVTAPFVLLSDAALAIGKSLLKLFRRSPQFLPITEEVSAAPATRSSFDTAAVVTSLDQSKPAAGITSTPAPEKQQETVAKVEPAQVNPAVAAPAPVSAPAPATNDAVLEEKTEHKAGFGS
jgi:hypothetical protein